MNPTLPLLGPALPPEHHNKRRTLGSHRRLAPLTLGLALGLLLWLQGCTTAPLPPPAQAPTPAEREAAARAPMVAASQARSARDYRRDAAQHLYARQAERIYRGRLPPMLYAVGVLHVDIGRQGQVLSLHWQRAPRHAPEVMAEIERMVRAAAPFPAPLHLSQVTYTDVWLWDKSGRFQLDTLTEGQD